jgi:hypothetical protein
MRNPTLPILFATFRWQDDSLARRSPFSAAALLETAAMYFEVELKSQFVASLKGEARIVQFLALNDALMSYLYGNGIYQLHSIRMIACRIKLTEANSTSFVGSMDPSRIWKNRSLIFSLSSGSP